MDFPINIRVWVVNSTSTITATCWSSQTLISSMLSTNLTTHKRFRVHIWQIALGTTQTCDPGTCIYIFTDKAKVYQTVVACDSRITSGSGCFRKGCYNRIQVRRTTWATLPPCHSRISACTLCSFLLVRRREIPVIQEAPSREHLPNPSVTLC